MSSTAILIVAMAFAAMLGASGQIVLKIGSGKQFFQMIPWLIGFAALYGVAVLINLWAYKVGGKVTFVYPLISLSYIFSALLAWKILGEPITATMVGGMALIMLGITLVISGGVSA